MATEAHRSSAALEDICRQLLDDWEFTPEQIANLAKDIPGECKAMAARDNGVRPEEE